MEPHQSPTIHTLSYESIHHGRKQSRRNQKPRSQQRKNRTNMYKLYQPDLILAFGDDHTDEDTFSVLPEDSYSIKVGGDASLARYWLKDYTEVRQLLIRMAQPNT